MDKTHYDYAYDMLSEREKILLDDKIEEWKKLRGHLCEKVVDNFKGEHFLPVDAIRDIMSLIVASNDESAAEVKDKLRKVIYRKYQLMGEGIKCSPYPKKLGFALSINEYKDVLSLLYYDVFDEDDEEIERFIVNATQGRSNPRYNNERYKKCLFKSDYKLLWLTWGGHDGDAVNDDPFCFMKYNNSKEVSITLGLDSRYFNSALLLFHVDIDKINLNDFILYRPTFCDSDFYENFKPTPLRFKKYGLTQPLSEVIVVDGNDYIPERRPECVVRSGLINYGLVAKVDYLND